MIAARFAGLRAVARHRDQSVLKDGDLAFYSA